MKSKLLIWNVRGLNKCLRIKNLLRQWKVETICLTETKLKLITSIIWSICGCQYVGWSYLAFNGALGGVLVMWERVVENLDEFVGEYSVAYSFKNLKMVFCRPLLWFMVLI